MDSLHPESLCMHSMILKLHVVLNLTDTDSNEALVLFGYVSDCGIKSFVIYGGRKEGFR